MGVRALILVAVVAAVAGAVRDLPAAASTTCAETPVSPKPPNAWMGRTLATHWLRSGTLWMAYTRADHAFVARPRGQKIAWWRAAGSPWGRLRVFGRRLDGDAPPLRWTTGTTYPFRIGFQSSALMFPTAGCWRIVARVGLTKQFVFVVRVEPDDGRR